MIPFNTCSLTALVASSERHRRLHRSRQQQYHLLHIHQQQQHFTDRYLHVRHLYPHSYFLSSLLPSMSPISFHTSTQAHYWPYISLPPPLLSQAHDINRHAHHRVVPLSRQIHTHGGSGLMRHDGAGFKAQRGCCVFEACRHIEFESYGS